MDKARKKPVIVDFLPIYDWTMIAHIQKWMENFGEKFEDHFEFKDKQTFVKTLEGTSYAVTPNHVIIRGVKGEYYPCERNIFRQTYDIIPSNQNT